LFGRRFGAKPVGSGKSGTEEGAILSHYLLERGRE
jgi:hypothetical protein